MGTCARVRALRVDRPGRPLSALGAPDAFLSSGDDLAWAEPRAAWIRRRAPAPRGGTGEWLVLDIDPPAPGRLRQIDVVVAVPRHPDEALGGTAVHVHILVPRDPAAIGDATIDAEQLDHAAWGALYATEQEARERYESLREADEATRGGRGRM